MITVDAVVLYIISFILASVEECPWDFTFFQKLIVSAIVVVGYYILSRVRVIGGILIIGFSALVTWFASMVLPLMKWVNESRAWYYSVLLILFVLLILLHRDGIEDSFNISSFKLNVLKRKLKTKLENKRVECERAANEKAYWKNYSDAQNSQEHVVESSTNSTSFFAGCNSEDDVKKRLRALTKTFHPDNAEGDEDTYKQILSEYENLKKKFGIQTQ